MAPQILLNHAQPIAEPLRNLCVLFALCNLCLCELSMTKVRRSNLCTTLFSSRPRACSAMQSAAAVSFVCWALARQALTCFGATPLAWPVRPKPPFNADGDVIFRYHFDAPFRGIILPQILQGHERGLSKCMDNVYWLRGHATAVTCT